MPQGTKNGPKVTRSVEFEFERDLRELEVELVLEFELERELEFELRLKTRTPTRCSTRSPTPSKRPKSGTPTEIRVWARPALTRSRPRTQTRIRERNLDLKLSNSYAMFDALSNSKPSRASVVLLLRFCNVEIIWCYFLEVALELMRVSRVIFAWEFSLFLQSTSFKNCFSWNRRGVCFKSDYGVALTKLYEFFDKTKVM